MTHLHDQPRHVLRWLPVTAALLAFGLGFPQSASAAEPAQRALPAGPLGDTIRLGKALVNETTTHPLTKPFVGNRLNCTSCHLEGGAHPRAASFLGVATAYPAWAPREGRVITLEDRILNCFMRSCNGVRPPLGSQPSVAIAAYITWLSTDEAVRMNGEKSLGPRAVPQLKLDGSAGNLEQGRVLYFDRCAQCHGDDGAGDDENPPLWGAQSYNDGAGLANNLQLASWLKLAMPLDDATLTDQEALDIATFVNSHPRPKFRLEEHLPAKERLGEYNSSGN